MAQRNGTSRDDFSRGILKVQGGKLLKVKLSQENGLISEISITGDFFIHPEESIEELEESLIGRETTSESLLPVLYNFFLVNEVVGAKPVDFLELILSTSK